MRTLAPITSLLAVAATTLLVAGCGGGDGDTATAGPADAAKATPSTNSSAAVKIADFKFMPKALAVSAGTDVMVTNDDSEAHTFTADDGHSFGTGDIDAGSSKSVSVPKPGSYPYHCEIHSFMHGKLTVR